MELKEIARELQGKAANAALRMPISWVNLLAGAPITGYRVYRQVGTGSFTLAGTVTQPVFAESVNPTETITYRVTAVNAMETLGQKRAIATMCIGVGQGIAALIERV